MAMKLPRIEVPETRKKELALKHNCTTQAVRNALKYQSDSDQARSIRRTAKRMLIEEANKISITIK